MKDKEETFNKKLYDKIIAMAIYINHIQMYGKQPDTSIKDTKIYIDPFKDQK